jgi:uncharacterized protein YycO
MSVTVTSQTAEELAQSVAQGANALETSRRVGWAKAFDNARRADSAERDLNVSREDNRILTKFAARAYGALLVSLGNGRIVQLFPSGDIAAVVSWLPDSQLNAGIKAMAKLLGAQRDELNQIREQIDLAKRQRELADIAKTDQRWKQVERVVRRDIMAQFNIPTDEEFFGWLTKYNSDG